MRDHPTFDGSTQYRCMLVGLDEHAMRDCSNALKPLIAIRASDVKDACAKMSDVLPLVIVITEDAAQAASPEVMPAFLELAEAIGAEVVTIRAMPDLSALWGRLLEAVRKAESRRHAR